MKAKFINPFTDFGFKKIFGEEASKPLLMDFLNALLPPSSQIADLTFKNTEQLGISDADRKAIYDIYCENESGEKFIVELQKAKQNYFKERTIFYSTFPIREQAEKGEWNYNLKAVYCVGILDFTFNDYETEIERKRVLHTIKLKNEFGETFYEKLTYIYLEMPNFTKTAAELNSRLDQWLFFFKNLEDIQTIPAIFSDKIFAKAFEKAELARFDQAEMDKYENSLKVYRDLKGVIDTAYLEGMEDGIQEGKIEGRLQGIQEGKIEGRLEAKLDVARALKNHGVALDVIINTTGLSREEIERL